MIGEDGAMSYRWFLVLLAAGVALALPAELSAQQPQPYRQAQAAQRQVPFDPRFDIEELTPGQIQRAQEPDRPAAVAPPPAKPPAPKQPAQPARAVACSGAFAKDSNHIKL